MTKEPTLPSSGAGRSPLEKGLGGDEENSAAKPCPGPYNDEYPVGHPGGRSGGQNCRRGQEEEHGWPKMCSKDFSKPRRPSRVEEEQPTHDGAHAHGRLGKPVERIAEAQMDLNHRIGQVPP